MQHRDTNGLTHAKPEQNFVQQLCHEDKEKMRTKRYAFLFSE